MTEPQPCASIITNGMQELHRWIATGVGVTVLMAAGVLLDRLRMIWGDYRKRHRINGSAEL